jgi:putative transcription factor
LLCEVCGRQIFGAPFRAIIEGANLAVCSECSKLGSGFWEQPKTTPKQRAKKGITRQPITFAKRKQLATVPETLELVENVGQMVRQAREGLGMSHEDLGRQTRERVSVLRKIENNKMVPDLVLAEKLEHTLKIKLRVPPSEPNAQISSANKPQETTLGDLIHFKLKKEEAEK